MRVTKKIKRLLENLLRRHRNEEALEDELRSYIEELTDRKHLQGMARDEAHRQALVEAGGIEQIKEEVREARLGYGIETHTAGCPIWLSLAAERARVFARVDYDAGNGHRLTLSMISVMRAVLLASASISRPKSNRRHSGRCPKYAEHGRHDGRSERSETLQSLTRTGCQISSADASLEYAGEMEHVAAGRFLTIFFRYSVYSPRSGGHSIPRSMRARSKHSPF